jgi:D-arabinose 1-dehydrogenase-like Zn-dependent alcohol dehydrogenase
MNKVFKIGDRTFETVKSLGYGCDECAFCHSDEQKNCEDSEKYSGVDCFPLSLEAPHGYVFMEIKEELK